MITIKALSIKIIFKHIKNRFNNILGSILLCFFMFVFKSCFQVKITKKRSFLVFYKNKIV